MGVPQLRGRITGALFVLIFLLTASKLMAGTVTVNYGTGSANSISASSTDRDVYIVGPGAAATVGNYAVEYKTQNPIITSNLLHVKFDGAAFNGAAIRVCNVGGVNASDAVAAAMPSAGTNSYYIQVVQNIGAGNSVYFTDAAACNGTNSNRFPVRLPASNNTSGTVKITIDGVSSGGILVDPNATAAANLVIVTGGACSYTLSATSASVGASNSTGSVSVTASASSCSWTAASNASWLTITSGSSGAGNGTVNYSVSANTATSSRSGALTIGGQTFTVTQSANNLCLQINQIDTSSCPTIKTYVTTTDCAGSPLTGLGTQNFIVKDDSIQQTITALNPVSSASPISTAITMDYSGSMSDTDINNMQSAAITFINLLSSSDAIEIIKFDSSISVVQSFTTDKSLLTAAVNTNWSRGSTALYDAVYKALQDTALRSGRKAVLAMTDGQDNSSQQTLSTVTAYATAQGIPIFTIGLGSASSTALSQMASDTGGLYYYAPTSTDLQAIYQSMANVLNNQYIISFNETSGNGQTHTLDISATLNGRSGGNARQFVSCTQQSCTITLTPQTQALSAGAATGSVNVTASASSCAWTATTADTWITITTGSSGTGNGTVRYSVAANTGTSSRTGTITIGGQTLTVTQSAASAGCSYTTTASVQSLGGNGGTGTITVTPSGTGCNAEWFATADVTWITFNNTCSTGICSGDTSGIGTGTVTFEVSSNTGATRSGNITLAGNIIPITQGSGQTCTTCGTTFNDVPSDNWASSYIYGIACSGITQGCGNSNYCVSNYVTRAHMAAFIVRGKEGEPPADYCASGSGFSDVATTDGFCKYIKRLGELQITLGCGSGNFCPSDYVTRGQMAAFLVRALYGENFTYTQTPYYSDVPATHGFFKYVQKLKDSGITRVSGTYNVNETVARDAMAAFLYKAFLETSCGNTSCTDASLKALVTDSQTGHPVSGATVTVGSSSATTDSTGYARITGLTAQQNSNNTSTVNVSATGYVSDAATTNISCGTENTYSVSLLPTQSTGTQRGDIRIILTWGENPIDVDSHLTGPTVSSSSSRFHVYYSSMNNCSSAACDSDIPAWLDVDDVTSYGPETITILSSNNSFTAGTYRYSVHHYAGSSNIVNSNAAVKVYQGSQLLHTYTPPVPASGQTVAGSWVWTVFELNVSSSGTISFATIGTYSGPTGAGSVQMPALNSAQKNTAGAEVLIENNTEDMGLFRRLERKR